MRGTIAEHASPRASLVSRLGGHPSAVWCFMGFLIFNMFSRHISNFGLPVGPDRIFFAATMTLMVLDRRFSLRSIRTGTFHLVALLMVTVALLSALAYGTLFENLGFFALLDRLVVPYLIFAFAPILFAGERDRELLLRVLTCIGLYLGLTAFAEILGPRAAVFPRYIVDPSIGIQFGRARGPFVASEANGLTLLATAYSALALSQIGSSRVWRLVGAVAAPLCLVGAILTLTRSIWLGAVLGALLVAVIEPRLRRRLGAALLIVVVLMGIVAVAVPTVTSQILDRAEESRSLYDRRNTNSAAIRATLDHPLTGVGWTRFIYDSQKYVRQDPYYPVTTTNIEVHNVVLARLSEVGIPGGVLWVLTVLLGPVRALARRPRLDSEATWRIVLAGTFGGWVVSVMSSPLPYPLPNNLVWLFAGLAMSSALRRPTIPEPR